MSIIFGHKLNINFCSFKILISQERLAYNKFYVFRALGDENFQIEAEIRSTKNLASEDVSALWIRLPKQKSSNSSEAMAKARKLDVDNFYTPPQTQNRHIKPSGQGYIFSHKPLLAKKYNQLNPGLRVFHITFRDDLPLLVLFKALGILDQKSIWEHIGIVLEHQAKFEQVLMSTLENKEAGAIKSRKEALICIG